MENQSRYSDMEHELRIMISVAEAGWKGSPCWHVLDWICWKQRCKYPLVRECDRIINWTTVT